MHIFNKQKGKERNINLDLIRSIAVSLVLSVHFFLNNGFYEQSIDGTRMYIMVLMRTFFMICVPLFLMLTGYLMCTKKFNKRYYLGIIRTLVLYILSSFFCMIFKSIFFHESKTLKSMLGCILNFSGASYSWYIKMYILLFILIPFLNFIWNKLANKNIHQVLLVGLLFFSILPSIMLFSNSSIVAYLGKLWPITYYFLGTYLRKYDIKISLKKNILLLVACVVVFGTINYRFNYQKTFQWTQLVDWNSFENIIDSVLVFLLILHLPLQNLPEWCKSVIKKIAELSLVIYLVSECFDRLFYSIMNAKVPVMPERLEWYPVIVPLVFACSMFSAQIIVWIYKVGVGCFDLVRKNSKEN